MCEHLKLILILKYFVYCIKKHLPYTIYTVYTAQAKTHFCFVLHTTGNLKFNH